MRYELYIDSYLLLQTIENYCAALLMETLAACRIGRARRLAGAAAGALFSCAALLLPGLPGIVRAAAGTLGAGVWVAGCAAGREETPRFSRLCADFFLAALWLGGAQAGAGGLWTLLFAGRMPAPVQAALCAGLTRLFTAAAVRVRRRRQETVFAVELRQGERRAALRGLADSGNSLREPISGAPVCLVEERAFDAFLPGAYRAAHPERFRVVPFSSIGAKRGILPGFLVEELIVHRPDRLEKRENVVLARAPGHVALAGRYQLILHRSLSPGFSEPDGVRAENNNAERSGNHDI